MVDWTEAVLLRDGGILSDGWSQIKGNRPAGAMSGGPVPATDTAGRRFRRKNVYRCVVTNRPPAASAPGSALEIEVVGGLRAGSTLLVTDELVMGRQTGGEGQFPDAEMSRRHARIARAAGGDYEIEDLGSSNGTVVNGLRIASPTLLSVGDSIELGGTALVVRSLPAPGEPAAAPVAAHERQGAVATPPSAQGPDRAGVRAEAAATPPTLAVRLEVDFEAGTAAVALDEGGDVVTMTFIDGHWRATSERPALSAERG
jgi:hypothetical protein